MSLLSRLRPVAVPLVAFLLGLAALGTTALVTLTPAGRQAAPSAVGGPFSLVDQDGRPDTERDLVGRPHLVFFGFTHGPDVCPTTLFQISEVLREARKGGKARDVEAFFVTVDPERDGPAALKSYLGSFDERVRGLTGDPAAVAAALKAYKAFSRKVPTKDGDYTMDHTAVVYLMDAQGRFVSTFNPSRPPAEAAADLARAL